MRVPFVRMLAGSLCLALLGGCTSLFEPAGWERVVGVTEAGLRQADGVSPLAPIILPEVVRRGVPFTATVVTYGSGSCTRADGATVGTAGLMAEVTPYDLQRTGNAICTDDLAPYSRTVTLRFDAAGEALIRVRGRTLHPAGPALHELRISVEP